jgi:hypothetical protein
MKNATVFTTLGRKKSRGICPIRGDERVVVEKYLFGSVTLYEDADEVAADISAGNLSLERLNNLLVQAARSDLTRSYTGSLPKEIRQAIFEGEKHKPEFLAGLGEATINGNIDEYLRNTETGRELASLTVVPRSELEPDSELAETARKDLSLIRSLTGKDEEDEDENGS